MTQGISSDRGALDEQVQVSQQEYDEAWGLAEQETPQEKVVVDETGGDGEEKKEPPVVEPPVNQDTLPNPDVATPPVVPDKDNEETYEQRWKSLQGIHRHDKETWEQEKARLTAEIEEAKKPKQPDPTPDAENTDKNKPDDEGSIQALYESLTDDQKALLKDYDEEFDTVSKMEGLKREAALKKLRKEFTAFRDDLLAQIAPVQTLVKETKVEKEQSAVQAHLNAIADAHPDFEKYRDDGSILKWIESKPAYLRRGLAEIYKSGTSEDVIEFLDDFKKENNIPIEQPRQNRSNVVEMDARKEARRKAMTAPPTRRGAVNSSQVVSTDYEGAWDEASVKG
jgi:hypothetical protein